MKNIWLLMLLCAVFVSAQVSELPDTSGNAFVRLCSSGEKEPITQTEGANMLMGCIGYVAGFIDGEGFGTAYAEDKTAKKVPSLLCFPDGVENGQIIRILLKYIRENPKDAHQRTAVLLVRAVRQAYPCPNK